ncbi:hypothetical protein E3T39_01870 [Cryobacterium suzukii]|uniref:RiboL-PSP-HEPN domain-containing protein n=1 Tax=Cryobacterium suzukii TaxID=1259198 RepID=A0A4R9AI66_9MICO|nr:hypothetical protein [Cryobacterium suzukii]TFD62710.1 hypothetical protein E3T39_01870 [Cryobacterium suzukii]
MMLLEDWAPDLDRLRKFQQAYRLPVSDIAHQAPAQALHSLRDAARRAPANYRQYLEEAINCYEANAYRGAVLMVWAATIEHLYSVIDGHQLGFKLMQAENLKRFEKSSGYRRISKKNDLLHLNDGNFIQLCEDAGVFNKNARSVLDDALKTRNRCGHPTGYTVGREEVVIFIERLINNVISGAMIDWD